MDVATRFPSDAGATLIVTASDPCLLMAGEDKVASWPDQADSDIVEAIVGGYGDRGADGADRHRPRRGDDHDRAARQRPGVRAPAGAPQRLRVLLRGRRHRARRPRTSSRPSSTARRRRRSRSSSATTPTCACSARSSRGSEPLAVKTPSSTSSRAAVERGDRHRRELHGAGQDRRRHADRRPAREPRDPGRERGRRCACSARRAPMRPSCRRSRRRCATKPAG